MYLVAVKETEEWYLCSNDIDAAKKVTELMKRFPLERLILAEQLELTVVQGDVAFSSLDDDHDCGH